MVYLALTLSALVLLSLTVKLWGKIVWLAVPLLFLGFIYLIFPLVYFKILNFEIPYFTLLFIPAFIHLLAFLCNPRIRESSPDWLIIASFACFVGYLLLSLLWTTNLEYGIRKFEIFGMRIFLPVMIMLTSKVQSRSLNYLGLAIQIIALIVAAELLFWKDDLSSERATILGLNPIEVSRMGVLALVISLTNLSGLRGTTGLVSRGLVIATAIFIIIMTASRGPIIGLFSGLCVSCLMMFYHKGKYIIKYVAILMITVVIVVTPVVLKPETSYRYLNLITESSTIKTDENVLGRMYLGKLGLRVFQNNPVVGKGLGGYFEPLGGSYDPKAPDRYPHNLIIEILAEGGIVGLIFMAFLFIQLFKRIVEVDRYNFGAIFLFITAFCFALASLDLSGNTEWLIIGVALSRYSNFLANEASVLIRKT